MNDWSANSPGLTRGLPSSFDAEAIGQSLQEAGDDRVASLDSHEIAKWFHSPLDADLFIWRDAEGRLIKFHLNYFGQVVEWAEGSGVQTGLVVEHETAGNETHETVRFDSAVVGVAIGQAAAILRSADAIGETEKAALIAHLHSNAISRASNRPTSAPIRAPVSKGQGNHSFWSSVRRFFRRSGR